MRRLIRAPLAVAVLAAGCETGDLEAGLDKLRAENAALTSRLEKLRAENAGLERRVAALAEGNAKVVEALRDEIREGLATPERPAEHPILLDPEVEERLSHKVEELQEAVWELSPSGCVRVLRAIIERHPNSRAALRAEGVLASWDVRGVEVTDGNAREIDERVRALLKERSSTWRRVQEAMRAAERGEAEGAVRALRDIAEEHRGESGRRALEILEGWGVAERDPAEIDFAELGPTIKREAAAQREIERAFRSLHRGHPEAAVRAFRKAIKKYPEVRQAERAREGLEDAEAELREQREERARERRAEREEVQRAKRRPRERRREPGRRGERELDEGEIEGREAEERRERDRPRGEREQERGEKERGEEEAGREEPREKERPIF